LVEAGPTIESQPRLRLTVRPRSPFDFPLTARVLRRSTRNLIDRVGDDGSWSRVVVLGRGPALLRGRQHGESVTFEAAPADSDDRKMVASLVTRLFSLDVELAPFFRQLHREPGFAELARRCAGLRPQRFPSLFEALANGFACQQLSLASGLMRLGHLCERFGPRISDGDGVRLGAPDPARIARAPVAHLRQAGFSNRRAEELRELARLPLDRLEEELDRMPTQEARARLLELPGVGPWTADYVLLRGLGRLDVFPSGDVGAARTLGNILGRAIPPARAGRIAARFSPLRGMLYFCMLGWVLGGGAEARAPDEKR
jgi:DNA-3-methyladenine glycosylase II